MCARQKREWNEQSSSSGSSKPVRHKNAYYQNRRHEKKEQKYTIKKALVFCEPQTVTAQNTTKQHFNSKIFAFFSFHSSCCSRAIASTLCVHPKKKCIRKKRIILTVKPWKNMRKSLAAFGIINVCSVLTLGARS